MMWRNMWRYSAVECLCGREWRKNKCKNEGINWFFMSQYFKLCLLIVVIQKMIRMTFLSAGLLVSHAPYESMQAARSSKIIYYLLCSLAHLLASPFLISTFFHFPGDMITNWSNFQREPYELKSKQPASSVMRCLNSIIVLEGATLHCTAIHSLQDLWRRRLLMRCEGFFNLISRKEFIRMVRTDKQVSKTHTEKQTARRWRITKERERDTKEIK